MPEVIMPKMGDAMEEGTLLQWLKQDGETVSAGDVIAEIETDKSNVEIEAEDAGVLHIQAQPGAVVPVGKAIAIIGDDVQGIRPQPQVRACRDLALDSAAPSAARRVLRNGLPPLPAERRQQRHGRLKASPLARSVAKQRGLDIAQIKGTGPQGRIIEADVLAFAGITPPGPVCHCPVYRRPGRPAARPGDARRAAEARRHDPRAADCADRTVRHAEGHRPAHGREQDDHPAFLHHRRKWTWPRRWPCARS